MDLLRENTLFRRAWLVGMMSSFGAIFYEIAVVWYLVTFTQSAMAVGVLTGAMLLGSASGSFLVGKVVDRYPTRTLMLLFGLLRLLVMLPLVFMASHLAVLTGVSFLFSGFGAAYGVAASKSVPEMVDLPAIEKANALSGVSAAIVRICSWGLGGLAVTVFTLETAMGIATGILLGALVLLFSMRWDSKLAAVQSSEKGVAFFKEGLKTIKSYPKIKRAVAAEVLFYGCMGFLWVAFPVRVSELGDGLLYGAHGVVFGLGWLLTSTCLSAKKSADAAPMKRYVFGFGVYMLGNFFLTFSPFPWLFLVGLFVSGLGTTYWEAFRTTLFHQMVPTEDVGKVFSVFGTLVTVILIPGHLIGGWLVDAWGTGAVMGATTLLSLLSLAVLVGPRLLGKDRFKVVEVEG